MMTTIVGEETSSGEKGVSIVQLESLEEERKEETLVEKSGMTEDLWNPDEESPGIHREDHVPNHVTNTVNLTVGVNDIALLVVMMHPKYPKE